MYHMLFKYGGNKYIYIYSVYFFIFWLSAEMTSTQESVPVIGVLDDEVSMVELELPISRVCGVSRT